MKLRTTIAALAASVISIASAGAQEFTIGLSNGWVGSEWRTQMIEEAEAAAAAWAEIGRDQSRRRPETQMSMCRGQIAHGANPLNQAVDAVIIKPHSPTPAFDPASHRQRETGVLVISDGTPSFGR